jgi:hypothetical protein
MEALFDLPSSYALISDDGLYRYALGRRWETSLDGPGAAVFVMLNPSTADAEQDDPTIRRCIGFAKALGCGGLHVVNLYAYRATKPADLWLAADPVGPDNDHILGETFRAAVTDMRPVIAAWGANARPDRVADVKRLARSCGLTLRALGITKDGAPRHPLYLRADSTPTRWPAHSP